MNQSQLQPVLFGALFIGVLSGLPIINIGNCCCLWLIGGGVLTAYLQQRDRAEPLPLGEGALGGCLAGIAGAVVYLAVYIPINIVTAPLRRGMIDFMINSGGDMPPEFREMLESFGTEGIMVGAAIGSGFMLIAGLIFSTLGGLFGVLLFRPSTPQAPPSPPYAPPAPPAVPPAPPPPPAPQD